MAVYTKRVQTVLTDRQFKKLSEISAEQGKPISELVRQAVEVVFFEEADRQHRLAAVERLIAMNLPVSDWDSMEDEIIRGSMT